MFPSSCSAVSAQICPTQNMAMENLGRTKKRAPTKQEWNQERGALAASVKRILNTVKAIPDLVIRPELHFLYHIEVSTAYDGPETHEAAYFKPWSVLELVKHPIHRQRAKIALGQNVSIEMQDYMELHCEVASDDQFESRTELEKAKGIERYLLWAFTAAPRMGFGSDSKTLLSMSMWRIAEYI